MSESDLMEEIRKEQEKKAYNLSMRRSFIDFDKYIKASEKIRRKYPFIGILKLRALIFNEGIKSILKGFK